MQSIITSEHALAGPAAAPADSVTIVVDDLSSNAASARTDSRRWFTLPNAPRRFLILVSLHGIDRNVEGVPRVQRGTEKACPFTLL